MKDSERIISVYHFFSTSGAYAKQIDFRPSSMRIMVVVVNNDGVSVTVVENFCPTRWSERAVLQGAVTCEVCQHIDVVFC